MQLLNVVGRNDCPYHPKASSSKFDWLIFSVLLMPQNGRALIDPSSCFMSGLLALHLMHVWLHVQRRTQGNFYMYFWSSFSLPLTFQLSQPPWTLISVSYIQCSARVQTSFSCSLGSGCLQPESHVDHRTYLISFPVYRMHTPVLCFQCLKHLFHIFYPVSYCLQQGDKFVPSYSITFRSDSP